jgi:poly(3-hydroxybutyrate) depolymerase
VVSVFASAFLISTSIVPRLRKPQASLRAQAALTADANGNDALQRQIVAKEREGLDALKAGNIARFGELTADDAVLIDAHGPASKAQVLQNVAGFDRLFDG